MRRATYGVLYGDGLLWSSDRVFDCGDRLVVSKQRSAGAPRLALYGIVCLVTNQADGARHFRSTAFRTTISLK